MEKELMGGPFDGEFQTLAETQHICIYLDDESKRLAIYRDDGPHYTFLQTVHENDLEGSTVKPIKEIIEETMKEVELRDETKRK